MLIEPTGPRTTPRPPSIYGNVSVRQGWRFEEGLAEYKRAQGDLNHSQLIIQR
jgi:hypothetical protein